MPVKSKKYKTGYVYNLENKDFIVSKNNCIVVHRLSNTTDYSIGSIHDSNHYGLFKIIENPANNPGKRVIEFIKTGSRLIVKTTEIKTGMIKDPDIWKVLIGKEYETNTSGKLVITSLHSKENGIYRFNVKFSSGYETHASINKILAGKVSDHSKFRDPEEKQIFTSNTSGDFEIIKFIGKKHHDKLYKIRFLDSGYEKNAYLANIYKGEVKDDSRSDIIKSPTRFQDAYLLNISSTHNWKRDANKISVAGIGYLGETYYDFMKNDPALYDKLYKRWKAMINRCYNSKSSSYNKYGKLGISVDKRWHNLSNYLNDVTKLPSFNRDDVITGKLQLDKDKLQKNKPISEKIYSKDTCIWLTIKENNSHNI